MAITWQVYDEGHAASADLSMSGVPLLKLRITPDFSMRNELRYRAHVENASLTSLWSRDGYPSREAAQQAAAEESRRIVGELAALISVER